MMTLPHEIWRWRLLCCLLCLAGIGAWAAAPQRDTLENGLRLVTRANTASQVVSVEMLIDYSALDEPGAFQGIRKVLVNAMLQGSPAAGGDTIRKTLAAVGGELEGRVCQDMLEFSVTVPSDALPVALSSLAEIACRPALSDDGIQLAIDQARARVNTPPVGAMETASRVSEELLYAGHPYDSFGQGHPESLARLTPALVRAAYGKYIIPSATVIAIAGNCVPETARGSVTALFANWPRREAQLRPQVAPPVIPESRVELREAPVNEACVMLTFPVCGVAHEDYLPLRVLDTLLSGGTGSRMFRTIREQRRLAYDVATIFPAQAAGSPYFMYALTDPQLLEETKTALVEQLAALQVKPVTTEELLRAQAYLKGRYLLSHQYSAQYAFDLAWYELAGLGVDYDGALPAAVDAVTAADVQRIARAYFTRYYLVVVIPRVIDGAAKAGN